MNAAVEVFDSGCAVCGIVIGVKLLGKAELGVSGYATENGPGV